MLKNYTCIMCPKGCEVEMHLSEEGIGEIKGNDCPKGKEYVIEEWQNPMRNLATSVLVEGGDEILASVRLSRSIPKGKIIAVVEEIRKVKLPAPIYIGQIIIKNVLNLDADVIATKKVNKIL